jgi:hypothetical protein
MARVIPEGWRELQAIGAAQRELETLARLASGLPDGYTVYHGIHWTRVENHRALVGEIDFAVVAPSGHVLVIEQKSGFLRETDEGLIKRYDEGEKNVPFQLNRNTDALRNRLREATRGKPVFVDALLYCPDYQVRDPGTAGIPPSRIVDARRRDQLPAIIQALLPADQPALESLDQIQRFLAEILQLVPDIDASASAAGMLYTRLAGGLAHWARQIDVDPMRLRITATAGSGKTQLALALMQEAASRGRRMLYACYNRPLADHVSRIAPAGVTVATYHQLGYQLCTRLGESIRFGQAGAFEQIEAVLARHAPDKDEIVDELIIDEGQDFRAAWVDALLARLAPGGRVWLLEDPMQNLYGRPALDLPGWVRLRSDINYRTPARIREAINRLLPLDRPIEAGSPVEGSLDVVTYEDTAGLFAETARAITRAYGAGFKSGQIAVITYRGREHSRLAPLDRLGPHALRAPTGGYDLFGNAEHTEGEVLIDSVLRFKGQSAPCVILTEVDFSTLDDMAIRRLFVGATRATLHLTLVLSRAATAALLERVPE